MFFIQIIPGLAGPMAFKIESTLHSPYPDL